MAPPTPWLACRLRAVQCVPWRALAPCPAPRFSNPSLRPSWRVLRPAGTTRRRPLSVSAASGRQHRRRLRPPEPSQTSYGRPRGSPSARIASRPLLGASAPASPFVCWNLCHDPTHFSAQLDVDPCAPPRTVVRPAGCPALLGPGAGIGPAGSNGERTRPRCTAPAIHARSAGRAPRCGRRHRRTAAGHSRLEPARRRWHLQPAQPAWHGGRPPAHPARRHGSGVLLRQPHEPAAVVCRSLTGVRGARVHRHHASQRGRRQHWCQHPGGNGAPGLCRTRPGPHHER